MNLSSPFVKKSLEIPGLRINLPADWDWRSPFQHEQDAELVGITMRDSQI